jgi:cation:H+ antiporter
LPDSLIALGAFSAGVVLAVWATERLLEGLVGLASATRLSTFAVGAILSGFEVENVAVGLAAARHEAPQVALGTVFGGATFLICVALGLGGLLYPLHVSLPRGVLMVLGIAPILAGLGLVGDRTPRWAGAVLLSAFVAAMVYMVRVSRRNPFLDPDDVREKAAAQKSAWTSAWLTVVGLVVIGVGGELVATGATRIVAVFGIPVALMGMVLTPAAIELEEVIRQAVPTREGRPEVSAGNLVGTLLYFVLFNLGVIALVAPVRVEPLVRLLDWPFLVGITWVSVVFLARGRVGRPEGALLLVAYALYAALHLVFPS